MTRHGSKQEQYELAIPRPDALVESLRSMGYSLPTAIADIVDNSIAASATTIWINFHWAGPQSSVAILDDGKGMSTQELFEAMRPGSQSPLEARSPRDLGRFGLGLKTASFSQCRNLTVASRQSKGATAIWRWDLDYVEKHQEWRLLRGMEKGEEHYCRDLDSMPKGTLVLWRNLDRVVDDRAAKDATAQEHFHHFIAEMREHLSMTFHRFLSGDSDILEVPLQIYINGKQAQHSIRPWDPFLKQHPATYRSPTERIVEGVGSMRVQGFVLPHRDRLSDLAYQEAAGPRGWVAQQGFYIYRNDRILVAGDWLRLGRGRLFQKDEHHRLARLSIDIANTQDFDWSLDVKKATARPPSMVRERLTDLAEVIRKRAREVFFHRGAFGPNPTPDQQMPLQRPWIAKERSGRNVYTVNREHPLVAGVMRKLGPLKEDLNAVLRIVEETVPVERIWLDTSEAPGSHAIPYEGLDEGVLWADMKRTFAVLLDSGYGTPAAARYISSLEPFNRYPELVARLEEI
jgi:hypothetical protein